MLMICLIYHFWQNFEIENIKVKKPIFCLTFGEECKRCFIYSYMLLTNNEERPETTWNYIQAFVQALSSTTVFWVFLLFARKCISNTLFRFKAYIVHRW